MGCNIKFVSRIVFLIACVVTVISVFRTLPVSFHYNRHPTPLLQFSHHSQSLESSKIPDSTGLDGEPEGVEEEEEWDLDQENIPELPLILGNSDKGPRFYNETCATFPDLFRVQFSNIHWQVQETTFETYFLQAAYLDVRSMNDTSNLGKSNATVRILVMSDNIMPTLDNSTLKACQFWFEGRSKPEFGNVVGIKMLWYEEWGIKVHYFPYIFSCGLPSSVNEVPASVSLVENKCDNATNNLNIQHRYQLEKVSQIPERNFGVCVKALDFPDEYMASRLVEWIETIRSLGADKIFFYEFYVNPAIKKILDHYESAGIIDVIQTTLPGELPNQPQIRHLYIRKKYMDKRLIKVVPYNDCLLRHMYEFKYMAVMDTDEVIMPKVADTWPKMLEQIIAKDVGPDKQEEINTYCFENVYFVDNMTSQNDIEKTGIPNEFHMLQHIYRSRTSTVRKHMKCFHSTSQTVGVHNHMPFLCLDGTRCNRHYVDFSRAQLNHYREICVSDVKNCTSYLKDTEKDTRIWRYKDEIMERSQEVLKIAA